MVATTSSPTLASPMPWSPRQTSAASRRPGRARPSTAPPTAGRHTRAFTGVPGTRIWRLVTWRLRSPKAGTRWPATASLSPIRSRPTDAPLITTSAAPAVTGCTLHALDVESGAVRCVFPVPGAVSVAAYADVDGRPLPRGERGELVSDGQGQGALECRERVPRTHRGLNASTTAQLASHSPVGSLVHSQRELTHSPHWQSPVTSQERGGGSGGA